MNTLAPIPPTLALIPGDSLDAFRQIYANVAHNVVAAAEMLARLCAADPGTLAALSSGPGALPEAALNSFLKVAERSLHPALLLNGCPAYQRLKGKPYSIQEAVVKRGFVEVVNGDGAGDFIRVDVVKLEGAALNQVIGPAGVRSVDEQRAWRKRKAVTVERAASPDAGPPYVIKKDRVVILRGNFELKRIEILRLLETMEA